MHFDRNNVILPEEFARAIPGPIIRSVGLSSRVYDLCSVTGDAILGQMRAGFSGNRTHSSLLHRSVSSLPCRFNSRRIRNRGRIAKPPVPKSFPSKLEAFAFTTGQIAGDVKRCEGHFAGCALEICSSAVCARPVIAKQVLPAPGLANKRPVALDSSLKGGLS